MSYARAQFVGITTLVVAFVPGYVWLRTRLGYEAWNAFWTCAAALVPWTIVCMVFDAILNLFRKSPDYPIELVHAPLFVLYFGVPLILLYEWLGLKWLLGIAGGFAGLCIIAGVGAALYFGKQEKDR